MAKVVSVNISEKKGTIKLPVEKIDLKVGLGIEGDAHAGDEGGGDEAGEGEADSVHVYSKRWASLRES